MGYARFVRSSLTSGEAAELEVVDGLAEQLRRHLAAEASRITQVHVHRASSTAVQKVVSSSCENVWGSPRRLCSAPNRGS